MPRRSFLTVDALLREAYVGVKVDFVAARAPSWPDFELAYDVINVTPDLLKKDLCLSMLFTGKMATIAFRTIAIVNTASPTERSVWNTLPDLHKHEVIQQELS